MLQESLWLNEFGKIVSFAMTDLCACVLNKTSLTRIKKTIQMYTHF